MSTARMTILGAAIGVLLGGLVMLVSVLDGPDPPADGRPDRAVPVLRERSDRAAPTSDPPPAAPPPGTASRHREARALQVFAGWSRRRGNAWAADDPTALRALYVSPAAARSDLSLLTSYRRRGLRVVGLASQVVAMRVVTWRTDRLVVIVDERSAGGVITGRGTPREVALPRDRVDRRRVVLVRRPGGLWQVERIVDEPAGG